MRADGATEARPVPRTRGFCGFNGFGRAGISLLLGLAACASTPPQLESLNCGAPDFPYREGWLGGDAAYSVPIGPDTTLWLFGDSFVASPAATATARDRVGAHLIHNSIALATCSHKGRGSSAGNGNGSWEFDYAWTTAADGTPEAFLGPRRPDTFWWLFDGFLYRDKLYLGLLEVQASEPRGAFNLPFRFTGVSLARIANFRAAPSQWRVEILPLSDHETVFPTSSLVLQGDYLYLFAFLDLAGDRFPRMLTRLPAAALEGEWPSQYLEYLSTSGDWKPGLEASDAQILMTDNASEMSVRYHPEIDRWLAIYSYPSASPNARAAPPSDHVYARTAQRLEGPWSEPRSIFRVPELAAHNALSRDPGTFCYAAKEHPQLAREGELTITYVCNLFARADEDPLAVLKRLAYKMDLYRPRTVSIPLSTIALPELPQANRPDATRDED